MFIKPIDAFVVHWNENHNIMLRGRSRAVARSDRWICLWWRERLNRQRLDQQTVCRHMSVGTLLLFITRTGNSTDLCTPQATSPRLQPLFVDTRFVQLLHTTDYQPRLTRPTGSQTWLTRWLALRDSKRAIIREISGWQASSRVNSIASSIK